MTAIFLHYHQQPYDPTVITEYLQKYLSQAPTGFEEEELPTFFAQHVALETVYHLRLGAYYDLIIPFLHDTSNYHNPISAARAMAASNTEACQQELMAVIADTTRDGFIQVMCVFSLGEFHPASLKEELEALVPNVSAAFNDFGGNIMDPRVCTSLPSVKKALEKLIADL